MDTHLIWRIRFPFVVTICSISCLLLLFILKSCRRTIVVAVNVFCLFGFPCHKKLYLLSLSWQRLYMMLNLFHCFLDIFISIAMCWCIRLAPEDLQFVDLNAWHGCKDSGMVLLLCYSIFSKLASSHDLPKHWSSAEIIVIHLALWMWNLVIDLNFSLFSYAIIFHFIYMYICMDFPQECLIVSRLTGNRLCTFLEFYNCWAFKCY